MSSTNPADFLIPGLHDPMPATKEISFEEGGLEFLSNLLDIINPLQHIPVVSTLYRAVTGDEISAPARMIGGALYGGPVGFASASANVLLEEATGRDLAEHALALVTDDGEPLADLAAGPQLPAAATPPVTPAPTATAQAGATPVAGAPADIVWNGPRVVPSLARAVPVDGQSPPQSASGEPQQGEAAESAAPPNDRAARPAPPGGSDLAGAGTHPAWLAAAIADAQSVHTSVQAGRTPPKPEAQPWVTRAMLDALDKYEALARERAK